MRRRSTILVVSTIRRHRAVPVARVLGRVRGGMRHRGRAAAVALLAQRHLLGQGVASGSAAYQGFYYTAGMLRDGDATLLVRKNALTPHHTHHTTHTLPMARASAGARGLTTEDGAKSTQTSSSAGSKGVWL